ncbi:rRNA cytosine-C5-methyltransferase [Bacteroidia bacterium]|nr:rRNA cytosine-C5-methyltransferase [Bacteroidia bacterium]
MKQLLGTEFDSFINALSDAPPVSLRVNKDKSSDTVLDILKASFSGEVAWCQDAFYLRERPIFALDPLFHAGIYYVQEASSMFLAHVLKQVLEQILPQKPLRVLDLCSAPGGKATLAASILPPDTLLIANEMVGSRAAVLKENIIRWGHNNITVTHNAPSDFARMTGLFDVIFVDAPCSGEGMFRKDKQAIEEWSEDNLRMCSNRQKQILSSIWDCLKPDGTLIYSTCTFNPGENEEVVEWMLRTFDAHSVELRHPFEGIVSTDKPPFSVRFYPHKLQGEGFFMSVIQKKNGDVSQKNGDVSNSFRRKYSSVSPMLPKEIDKMIDSTGLVTYQEGHTIGIIPEAHQNFIQFLAQHLNVIYKGCELVEINERKLKLLHPLALYKGLKMEECPCYDTDLATALRYLKKEDLSSKELPVGWLLVTYNNIGIGWGKNVGSRLNNYLPNNWRIRMKA